MYCATLSCSMPLCFVVDGVCQPAPAPLIHPVHHAAVGGHNALKALHQIRTRLIVKRGVKDIHDFVLIHAFSPPYGLTALDACPRQGCANYKVYSPHVNIASYAKNLTRSGLYWRNAARRHRINKNLT